MFLRFQPVAVSVFQQLHKPSLHLQLASAGIVRTLYGAARLGVDGYRNRRQQVAAQLEGSREEFQKRLESFMQGQETMAFGNELTNLIHVATEEEQDQTLLVQLLCRFHAQNEGVRFSTFVYGPVVMRMYWHLNLPDKALEVFYLPELEGMFDQLASYTLLMDLLFENARYADVLRVFETVQSRQLHGSKYPKDCVVLALATCYKQNTSESYEYVLSLLAELDKVGHVLIRRAAALAAAVMLRQGAAHEALSLLSARRDAGFSTLRDLRAACLTELDRPGEAVELLRAPLLADLSGPQSLVLGVAADVVERVDDAVSKKTNATLAADWSRVKEGLASYSLIKNQTLESLLLLPIKRMRMPAQPNPFQASFNRGQPSWQRRGQEGGGRRPGLTDMVD